MKLLLPLGLLGLLGIAILIFIYIIRPNYQQKLISSTYIWKLSLKYKKKRISTNRLRNILIFLCQLLILSSFAFLLARPVIPFEDIAPQSGKIVIIDASAGMRVADNGETRFERAVTQVKQLAEQSLAEEGSVLSVIVADETPYFLISGLPASRLAEINTKLNELIEPELKCSYGSADLDGAAALAQEVLNKNAESEVILYTATDYLDKTNFTVVNVAGEDEWNISVLNCTPKVEENNYYSFTAEVGCYGRAKSATVYCDILGANEDPNSTLHTSKTEYFSDVEQVKSLTFDASDFGGVSVISYSSVYIYVDEQDSFEEDNFLYVYGGTKPTVKIQYASSRANNFFPGVMRTLRETQKKYWDVSIKEVKTEDAAKTGFDIYIFEHTMPDVLPTDGVVLLINPDKEPQGGGFRLGDTVQVDKTSTLASGTAHEITANVNPENITVHEYQRILGHDGFEELLYYQGDPILLVKNQPNEKIVLFSLNLNQSSLAVVWDFPIMIYNIFNYFLPVTLTQNAFEVGDVATLTARGEDLTVDGAAGKITFDAAVGNLVLDTPGSYTVTQRDMKGDYIVEQFFVRIPTSESDITKKVDSLPLLHMEKTMVQGNTDLLFYIALATVAVMCAEWWLHSRENF